MRGSNIIFGAAAMVFVSWAMPAQAYRSVMLNGDGSAVVCDTSWTTICWNCYDSSITGNPGWECLRPWNAIAFKPPHAEQKDPREQKSGWVVDYAPKDKQKAVSVVKAEHRRLLASKRSSGAGSSKVEAAMEKLFPDKINRQNAQ